MTGAGLGLSVSAVPVPDEAPCRIVGTAHGSCLQRSLVAAASPDEFGGGNRFKQASKRFDDRRCISALMAGKVNAASFRHDSEFWQALLFQLAAPVRNSSSDAVATFARNRC